MLANGSYTLRLTATDDAGNTSTLTRIVNVAGELKLGDFRMTFTDLTIPVMGIPLTVLRTYDSLIADQQGDFGFGWRFEFGKVNLRTSLPSPETAFTGGGRLPAFQDGTRIVLTPPGNRPIGFTFRVREETLLGVVRYYHPVFVPDPGVTAQLSVPDVRLVPFNGQGYISATTYNPFNPAAAEFGGVYALTTSDGAVFTINAGTGKLRSVRDRAGRTIDFSPTAVQASDGTRLTINRDFLGRITSIVDPAGKALVYRYDAAGDLIDFTDRADRTTRYEYNAPRDHYLTDVFDGTGVCTAHVEFDPETGRVVGFRDANGVLEPLSYVIGVAPGLHSETITNVNGIESETIRDDRGNVVRQIVRLPDPHAPSDPTKVRYNITVFEFDSTNRMVREAMPFEVTQGTLAGLGKTRFNYVPADVAWRAQNVYDAAGNVTSSTDALGNVTRYVYDRFGNPLSVTDARGYTSRTAYDAGGNPTSMTDGTGRTSTLVWDPSGLLTRTAGLLDGAATFGYDARKRLSSFTGALGHVVTYDYDDNNRVTAEHTLVTTPAGVVTVIKRFTYNGEGQVTSITDPENGLTRYEYDLAGQLSAEIDALGRRTEHRYDDAGNLKLTIFPDATPADLLDNPRRAWEYDALGQRIAEIDELGRRTEYRYDNMGNQVEVIYPDDTPANLADNPRQRMTVRCRRAAGRRCAMRRNGRPPRHPLRGSRQNLDEFRGVIADGVR